MMLLERESSLALLTTYAEEARDGQGRLVLVAGEPGVGKSTRDLVVGHAEPRRCGVRGGPARDRARPRGAVSRYRSRYGVSST